MKEDGLSSPPQFILDTICQIRNNMYHGGTRMIPAVAWYGAPQDLSTMRAIGSTVYIWQPHYTFFVADVLQLAADVALGAD